ncbi:hypothetical protein GIB67_015500 [Kingdonia uniflora]|uniref:Uncharacterized protein n=1 Tax=Kingdonia uniflora TaxID=39325 RepID=A0A7J7LAA9_9MAGN|nr:hypothetical protein GIB67_015500 [Kingdonia uniflora]
MLDSASKQTINHTWGQARPQLQSRHSADSMLIFSTTSTSILQVVYWLIPIRLPI